MSAGLGIGLEADLVVDLCGKLGENTAAQKAMLEYQRTRTPKVVAGTGSLVGGTAPVLNLGGPPGGKTWQMRRLSFGPPQGQEGAAITAGTVVFQSAGNEIIRTTTVPNMLPWSHGQLTVRYPAQLRVVWLGGVGQLVFDWQALEEWSSADWNP